MSEIVESPCVGVCVLNPAAVCTGCGRRIEEIAAWSQLDDPGRRAVRERAAARLAELERPSAATGQSG